MTGAPDLTPWADLDPERRAAFLASLADPAPAMPRDDRVPRLGRLLADLLAEGPPDRPGVRRPPVDEWQ